MFETNLIFMAMKDKPTTYQEFRNRREEYLPVENIYEFHCKITCKPVKDWVFPVFQEVTEEVKVRLPHFVFETK